MPVTIPTLDDRRYPELVSEALARIPVHTPEWTNFQQSDPGVTLIEVFAFLVESLAYRANQIPERNRLKFLQMLNIPLQEATAAQGLVSFERRQGSPTTSTLLPGVELRAGQIAFRTTRGVEVLPVEVQIYYKRTLDTDASVKAYYNQLYASFETSTPTTTPTLYEAVPFSGAPGTVLDLSQAADGSFWVALLLRASDKPYATALPVVRKQIEKRVFTLAVAPSLNASERRLAPLGQAGQSEPKWACYIPSVPASGGLPTDPLQRIPQYKRLQANAIGNVFEMPGLLEVALPEASGLTLWNNMDPLEAGVGDFPPALDDTAIADRVITWLRFQPEGANSAPKFVSIAGNAAPVTQRVRVTRERLPAGTGEPDQTATVANPPVIADSVKVHVTTGSDTVEWSVTDDLYTAGPEVLVTDPRQPPGTVNDIPAPATVFALDAESGRIRFGDGAHGARPPVGADVRVDYDYSAGSRGNVAAGAITSGANLPSGIAVANPVATWGGADAETVAAGEKQITRYLQNRDRLVTVADFAAIALRTPGVTIGRIDIIPNYNPGVTQNIPGDAAGAVTVVAIPRYDAGQPEAPRADSVFLDAICRYLDERRLVTTEVIVRGPDYKDVYISVGIQPAASAGNSANVREAVKTAVGRFLSPLPENVPQAPAPIPLLQGTNQDAVPQTGWPLRKKLLPLEVASVVARVPGVEFVTGVLIALASGSSLTEIPFSGLELPRLAGISVGEGEPTPVDQLRGSVLPNATGQGSSATVARFPAIPETCR